MNEAVRTLLEQQKKRYPRANENVIDAKFIHLSQVNLPRVEPGMFWYEDDSVSKALSFDKKLKSIVLLVKDGIIFGDSFNQRYVLGDKIDVYLKELQEAFSIQFSWGKVYRSDENELREVYNNLKKINGSLRLAKKLKWSEELYWAQANNEDQGTLVDMLDGESLQMINTRGAYVRPMIVFMV